MDLSDLTVPQRHALLTHTAHRRSSSSSQSLYNPFVKDIPFLYNFEKFLKKGFLFKKAKASATGCFEVTFLLSMYLAILGETSSREMILKEHIFSGKAF